MPKARVLMYKGYMKKVFILVFIHLWMTGFCLKEENILNYSVLSKDSTSSNADLYLKTLYNLNSCINMLIKYRIQC